MLRFALGLVLCLAAAAAPASGDAEIAPGVFLAHGPADKTVRFRMIVRAGCGDEAGGCRGVSHYLEHLMLVGRNAQHEDQALRFFADGSSNGWTRHASTGYSHSFPAGEDAIERLDRLFAFYAARLEGFDIAPQEAARERNVVLQEHNWRVGSNPYAPLWREVEAWFFPGHPLGQWAIADPATIQSYTVEEAKAFHARWYRRDHVAFFVAGPVEAAALKAIVDRRLGAAPAAGPSPARDWLKVAPPAPETRRFARADARIVEPAATLWRTVRAPDLDAQKLRAARWLLVEFLASRLPGGPHAELVDRQEIARSVRGFSIDLPAEGIAQIAMTATPDGGATPDATLAALSDYLAGLARRGLDEATLARLKQRYALAWERASRNAQARAARASEWFALAATAPPDPAALAHTPGIVAALTKAEVDAVLAALAGPGREAQLVFTPAAP